MNKALYEKQIQEIVERHQMLCLEALNDNQSISSLEHSAVFYKTFLGGQIQGIQDFTGKIWSTNQGFEDIKSSRELTEISNRGEDQIQAQTEDFLEAIRQRRESFEEDVKIAEEKIYEAILPSQYAGSIR